MSVRKFPANVTQDEQRLVLDFIVIPIMLNYIDEDISAIKKYGLRTDLILINALRKVRDDILAEHSDIKLKMRQSGIKIIGNTNSKLGVDAAYLCRGYHHSISLLWSLIRTEVLSKASQYTGIKLTQ
ncbi:hypothetical protein [Cohnella sp.]|uniref:hypothetical protein n=1 Tax=Cohnella sp. TaxID=1883426 RepID=UPI003566CD3D